MSKKNKATDGVAVEDYPFLCALWMHMQEHGKAARKHVYLVLEQLVPKSL